MELTNGARRTEVQNFWSSHEWSSQIELSQLIDQIGGAHKWSSQNQGTKFVELIDGASTSYGQNSGARRTEVQNLWS